MLKTNIAEDEIKKVSDSLPYPYGSFQWAVWARKPVHRKSNPSGVYQFVEAGFCALFIGRGEPEGCAKCGITEGVSYALDVTTRFTLQQVMAMDWQLAEGHLEADQATHKRWLEVFGPDMDYL